MKKEPDGNIDVYNFMLQEDVKKYSQEREMTRIQNKKNQQSWANYLKLQMEAKNEKKKAETNQKKLLEQIMVKTDELRVTQDIEARMMKKQLR